MTLEINLPKSIEKSFLNLAKAQKTTKEELIQRAILEYLQGFEEHWQDEYEKLIQDYKNGKVRAYASAKEAFKQEGLI